MNYQKLAYQTRASTDNRFAGVPEHKALLDPKRKKLSKRSKLAKATLVAARDQDQIQALAEVLDLRCTRCKSNENRFKVIKRYGPRHWALCVPCSLSETESRKKKEVGRGTKPSS